MIKPRMRQDSFSCAYKFGIDKLYILYIMIYKQYILMA